MSENALKSAVYFAKSALRLALRYRHDDGGALLILEYGDGISLDQPADPESEPIGFHIHSGKDVQISNSIFDTDVMSPTFGQPLVYDCLLGAHRRMVHRSRCILFFGKQIHPNLAYLINMQARYWGLPGDFEFTSHPQAASVPPKGNQ